LALELDPALPPPPVERVSDLLERTVSMQRVLTTLLGLFAALAVTLSAVGLYGVIAYTVRQRIREIGIRVALGAARRDIVRLVVMQGLGLTAVGLVLGCCAAVAGTRLIRSMLFGVSTLDVASFAAAAAVLFVIALLACLAPTFRALRVDPAVALRGD
jgi:putative ABC transport system permease protein